MGGGRGERRRSCWSRVDRGGGDLNSISMKIQFEKYENLPSIFARIFVFVVDGSSSVSIWRRSSLATSVSDWRVCSTTTSTATAASTARWTTTTTIVTRTGRTTWVTEKTQRLRTKMKSRGNKPAGIGWIRRWTRTTTVIRRFLPRKIKFQWAKKICSIYIRWK